MKKIFILITSLLLLLVSCKNPVFLPNPNIDDLDPEKPKVDNSWHAPRDLKATQGKKRKIILSWENVTDAVRYYIYESDTPFGKFTQCGETLKKETTFEIKANAGHDMYYRVTAVNHDGIESEKSDIVRATTLAKPIISDIEGPQDKADSSVFVSWYMNNADAYAEGLHYNIVCYDDSNKEVKRLKSNGLITKVLFEGLNPNTNYLYKVEAYNNDNDREESAIVDAATARRLKPDPVTDLVISQGVDKQNVKLSFKLPNHVDVLVGKNLYEPTPIYFTISRREWMEGENPNNFIPLEKGKKFGAILLPSGDYDYSHVDFGSGPVEYQPGSVVEFIDDENLKRDVKYEYKVQSFAYINRSSPISAETSIVIGQGWLLPNYFFETQNLSFTYVDEKGVEVKNPSDEEKKNLTKTTASIKFNFSMNTMDIPYKFVINQYKREIKDETNSQPENKPNVEVTSSVGEGIEIFTSNSVEDILHFTKVYSLPADSGYYSYEIKIFDSNGTKELDTYKAIGEALVTDSKEEPVMGAIRVITGYADKIDLQWEWDSTFKYKLSYRDEGSNTDTIISHDDLFANYDSSKSYITYSDTTAKIGVVRTYQLIAECKGFTIYSKKMNGIIPELPKLEPIYSYDKVSAQITNRTPENFQLKSVEASFEDATLNDKYALVRIPNTNPLIFDYQIALKDSTVEQVDPVLLNASILGSKVNITVIENRPLDKTIYDTDKTTNEKGDMQELKNSLITASLGQALIHTVASKADFYDKIEVTWDKVLGSNTYVIFRDKYFIGATENEDDLQYNGAVDKYIIQVSDEGLVSLNLDVELATSEKIEDYVSVNYDKEKGQFKLIEKPRKLRPDDFGSSWKEGQSQITWGAPYKYTIIPVLSLDDATNAEKDTDSIKITETKFGNLSSIMGGTKGFGWNVTATKGDYTNPNSKELENGNVGINDSVKISWTKPYFGTNEGFSVWRRIQGQNDWSKLTNTKVNQCVDSIRLTQGTIYEYAVIVGENPPMSQPDKEFVDSNYSKEIDNKLYMNSGFILPNATINKIIRDNLNIGEESFEFRSSYINGKMNNLFDGYVIQVRNNNIDNKWHDVETITLDENNSYKSEFVVKYDNLSTNGLLKVLRDYKHYYRVRLYKDGAYGRVYSLGDILPFSEGMNNDYVKWSDRNLTADEFARVAIIALSTGMEKERGNIGSDQDGIGIPGLKSTSGYKLATDFQIEMIYKDYDAKHSSKGTGSDEVSAVKINGTLYARGGLLNAYQTHYWTSSPIRVTYRGHEGKISFEGSTSKGGDTVSRSNGNINVEWCGETRTFNLANENDRKLIGHLPFALPESSGLNSGYLNNTEEWQ